MDSVHRAHDITGLVLAGGQAIRMGGVDKGLQPFHGSALAWHAMDRLRSGAGVATVALNANRHLAQYAAWGAPVWPDRLQGYCGPLAGIASAMEQCRTPLLLTVPCDCPLFPRDLAQRLTRALDAAHADIAIAAAIECDWQGHRRLRPQPVFCLLRVALRASLDQYLQADGRKVGAWQGQHVSVQVPFDQPGDDPLAFANANTLEELAQLQELRT